MTTEDKRRLKVIRKGILRFERQLRREVIIFDQDDGLVIDTQKEKAGKEDQENR